MALPVQGYPDYLVYESGKIWSNKTNKFLKPAYNKGGYASVELFNENGSRRFLIHRLVAFAFIPNPNNYPQVNHKDENPANNNVDNLEWCSATYNMNYGYGAFNRHKLIDYSKPSYSEQARINGKAVSIPVDMLTKDGTFIKSFSSFIDASRETGIDKTNIARAANGQRKTAGGYVWKRKEE